jgi:hypothetical protein
MERDKDGVNPSNRSIDPGIRTMTLVHSPNSTLVIRVDEKRDMVKIHVSQEVDKKLDGNCLKKAYVATWNFPVAMKLKSCPLIINNNTNAPICGCILSQFLCFKSTWD